MEYEGFLKGLPRLQNTEGGNQIISQVVQAKARPSIERAQIVTDYQNRDISAEKARTMLAALNKQSILSPDLKQMIDNAAGAAGAPPDSDGWKTRSDAIRIRRKGG